MHVKVNKGGVNYLTLHLVGEAIAKAVDIYLYARKQVFSFSGILLISSYRGIGKILMQMC